MSVRKRWLLNLWFLVVVALVCLATTSCGPKHFQTTPQDLEQTGLDGQADKKTTSLSRELIIKAANKAVRQRGYRLAKYDIFYDEGNARWHRYIREVPALVDALKSRLEGHDYQFLVYLSWPPHPGGQIQVMIDRNTGEELWFKAGDYRAS